MRHIRPSRDPVLVSRFVVLRSWTTARRCRRPLVRWRPGTRSGSSVGMRRLLVLIRLARVALFPRMVFWSGAWLLVGCRAVRWGLGRRPLRCSARITDPRYLGRVLSIAVVVPVAGHVRLLPAFRMPSFPWCGSRPVGRCIVWPATRRLPMSGGFIVAHHASCTAPFPAQPRRERRLGDAQPAPLGRARRLRTLSIFLGMWFSATYTTAVESHHDRRLCRRTRLRARP